MACDPFGNLVVLACHFDGTNGSTTFTDEKGHTLTAYGNAQLTTTSPKFGTACGTFDGTGDYVEITDAADLELGGSDYTIDFWVKTTQTLAYACPLVRDNGSFPSGAWAVLLNGPGSGWVQFWNSSYSAGGALLSPAATSNINDGNWHHVAIVRAVSTHTLYVDGVAKATATWAGSIADVSINLAIGRDPGYSRDFNGQIDSLRITKAARYAANFTPPTATFVTNQCAISGTVKDASNNFVSRLVRLFRRDTAALIDQTVSDATTGAYELIARHDGECFVMRHDSDGDPLWDNTVLLCHFNGTNGSTTFTDEKGHTLTANGNAQISTTQSKFGGASGYFDGVGDYLSVAASELALGTGDFTAESWFYVASLPSETYAYLFDTRTSDAVGFGAGLQNDGKVFLYSVNAFRVQDGSVTTGAWNHIAICRSSGVTRLFLNGTQVGSDWSNTTDYTQTTVLIGKYYGGSAYAYAGYIDDVPITKAARYTGDFTPPPIAFKDYALAGDENALVFDRVVPS